MVEIKSPLGTKNLGESTFRTFTVPDESGYSQSEPSVNVNNGDQPDEDKIAELERRINELRKAKIENRLSPEAKRRVELLAGLGRLIREVKIGDNTFTLRTLTGAEQKELSLVGFSLAKQERGDIQFEIRSQILARSLHAIDGQSFNDIVGSDDVDVKIAVLEQMDGSVIDFLISEYRKLSDENNRKFGINTEEDVKEVVEDLKKA